MIKFTDPKLYVMGTCAVQFANTQTGNVEFWSDKVQNFTDTSGASENVIRAGLNNGIATVLTTDSEKTITAAAANFSLKAKAMQLGGTVQYNGISPICKVLTANDATLTVNVTDGAPVANYGYTEPMCYVQEVNAASPIATFGVAYPIDAQTGAITGFSATAGTQYKVWYFVRKVGALEATIYDAFRPGVYHATFQLAVYRNMSGASTNEGTQVGWLYCVYPRYKMTVGGGMVGDQTTADTTDLSGRALPMDTDVISGQCSDCETGVTAYYVYVPFDNVDAVSGILTALGGVITLPVNGTYQVAPMFIMDNGQLISAAGATGISYRLTGINDTGISTSGLITAGATSGTGTLTTTYTRGDKTLTDVCTVSVVTD